MLTECEANNKRIRNEKELKRKAEEEAKIIRPKKEKYQLNDIYGRFSCFTKDLRKFKNVKCIDKKNVYTRGGKVAVMPTIADTPHHCNKQCTQNNKN